LNLQEIFILLVYPVLVFLNWATQPLGLSMKLSDDIWKPFSIQRAFSEYSDSIDEELENNSFNKIGGQIVERSHTTFLAGIHEMKIVDEKEEC